jgi:hypothetical protein
MVCAAIAIRCGGLPAQRAKMLGYVVRRSAQSLLLVWLVTVVVFALLHPSSSARELDRVPARPLRDPARK